MTNETREILDKIDKALVKGDITSSELWRVLTALRGPDSGSNRAKHDATVPIRRAAFPKVAQQTDTTWGYINGADFGMDGAKEKNVRLNPTGIDAGHFNSHAHGAAVALGLEVTYER